MYLSTWHWDNTVTNSSWYLSTWHWDHSLPYVSIYLTLTDTDITVCCMYLSTWHWDNTVTNSSWYLSTWHWDHSLPYVSIYLTLTETEITVSPMYVCTWRWGRSRRPSSRPWSPRRTSDCGSGCSASSCSSPPRRPGRPSTSTGCPTSPLAGWCQTSLAGLPYSMATWHNLERVALIAIRFGYFAKHKYLSCMSNRNNGTERKERMFYLTMHSTHFIYGYMASNIWLRTRIMEP